VSLYDHYKYREPWDKDLPTDLIPPIKHLRSTFDNLHQYYGQITEKLCYYRLHPGDAEDIEEYLAPLRQLQGIVGVPATQRFIALLKTGTPPAIFKAFFDLYMDAMTRSALAIFFQLVDVGKANESRLGLPHLEWAEAQTRGMIRSKIQLIDMWIRNVCDKQPYEPNEDIEERIFWRKWQAPMLLVMKPSRYILYDPERNWERLDLADSRGVFEAFAVDYVIHIEERLKQVAGQTALALAKQPKPVLPPAPQAPSNPEQSPKLEEQPPRLRSTRREEQRRETQAKYKSSQKEYLSLKKANPDKSDVWYFLRIARMEISRGSNSETIRKHMKRR